MKKNIRLVLLILSLLSIYMLSACDFRLPPPSGEYKIINYESSSADLQTTLLDFIKENYKFSFVKDQNQKTYLELIALNNSDNNEFYFVVGDNILKEYCTIMVGSALNSITICLLVDYHNEDNLPSIIDFLFPMPNMYENMHYTEPNYSKTDISKITYEVNNVKFYLKKQ